MKFGLEAEKFIFDTRRGLPSKSVFSLLNALSDFELNNSNVTNEFVLHMIEFGTNPSENPSQVLKEYLFNYLLIQNVAAREQVSLAPLAALPMDYLPHMTPKFSYYVQNSILSGSNQIDWMMNSDSPLRTAGNCAGVHVHAEVETPPEFLYSNNELKNKFNMGLMMTPMIAFASSPYFFSGHEGKSMRGLRYYRDLYQKFPLNGALAPVMSSSIEVLDYMKQGQDFWLSKGMEVGFTEQEMNGLIREKSANWGPVRWNYRWNTIEIRCLDSDSLELDAAKFVWMCGAMKRTDVKGENLQCSPLKTSQKLSQSMIRDCFKQSGSEVTILSSEHIQEVFGRAMISGTKDELVEAYLHELADFARSGVNEDDLWIFKRLESVLENHLTTSEWLLHETKGKSILSAKEASELVNLAIESNDKFIETLFSRVPDVFRNLGIASKGRLHV